MDDHGHWPECETCNRTFRTQQACTRHMNATNHWAPEVPCETCNRTFTTQQACNRHMDAINHWAPEIPCETCNLVFRTEQAAEDHMAAAGHWKNCCSDCDRHFTNESNLRQHLNSRTHRGADVKCPFCKAG